MFESVGRLGWAIGLRPVGVCAVILPITELQAQAQYGNWPVYEPVICV
jgi:hypothetical protein